ncbi:MAG: recombinase family protein [Phycisphaerales bacterium]|nr:recombinase family protein [Phycisphaerales bacterium]
MQDQTFVVLCDEAVSGSQDSRPGFDQLKALIYADRLGVLIVTEQSRLSRGDNAKSLVKDAVFHGGRYISVTEGIDTHLKGWKMIVGFSELHHSRSNEDTAERVRGGQEGRVRDGNGSAGDYCYGYASAFADPVAAAAYRARGPKPKRIVVIEPAAAELVRQVFQKFAVRQESMNAIVRWWNEHRDEFPSITRKVGARIRIDHVRRIVRNQKYIGRWSWGATTTIYDGGGHKKQIPTRPDQTVITERPDLRIIDQEVWDKAQAQLSKLKEIYGMKPEGKKRGPAAHYRVLYEKSLLGGKVTCGACGARLRVVARLGAKRLACSRHLIGKCPISVTLPYDRAEQAVLSVLGAVLSNSPGWLTAAAAYTRRHLEELARAVPEELTKSESEFREVCQQLERLVDAVVDGNLDGSTVAAKLAALEARKSTLSDRLTELRQSQASPLQMPDDAWIKNQLEKLAGLLKQEMASAAQHLRPFLSKVVVEQIKRDGQKHGHVRLRFTIDGCVAVSTMLAGKLPAKVLSRLPTGDTNTAGEFTTDFGRGTCIEQWGPLIAQWRAEGASWAEVGRRTGLNPSTAFLALKRWNECSA